MPEKAEKSRVRPPSIAAFCACVVMAVGAARPLSLDHVAAQPPPTSTALASRQAAAAPSVPTDSEVSGQQRGAWSEPLKISGETGGWFPDVTADAIGNVHVVWNGGFSDTTIWATQSPPGGYSADAPRSGPSLRATHQVAALYYVNWDGHGWTEPNDIALIWYGHALRSSITSDPTGRVHLIYKGLGRLVPEELGSGNSLGSESLWYTAFDARRRLSAQSLRLPKRMTRSTQGYFSDIAIDSRHVIHAIWTESANGSWGVYYAHSADDGETWSKRVALEPSGAVYWYRAQLKVDAGDRVHVVWELLGSNTPHVTAGAVYAMSSDGGSTWSRVRFPDRSPSAQAPTSAGPVSGPQQPAIGIDGGGNILLVFREQGSNRILYRRSTDGANWSAPAPIPGVGAGVPRPFDVYDMATDSAGHVHLAVVAYRFGTDSMALLHLEWDGRQWGLPSVIAGSPPFPEYPRLAVGEGNRLHVVWFGGDRGTIDRTAIGIWYSTAQSSAPRVPTAAAPETRGSEVPDASVDTPTSVTSSPQAKSSDPIGPRLMGDADASPPELSVSEYHPEYPVIFGLAAMVLLLTAILVARAVLRRLLA